jgi:hypothetical protein
MAKHELTKSEMRDLAREINDAHEQALSFYNDAVQYALKAGQALAKAKAGVGHGGWLEWLKKNVHVQPRQVQNYMRLAARVAESGGKLPAASSLEGAIAALEGKPARARHDRPTRPNTQPAAHLDKEEATDAEFTVTPAPAAPQLPARIDDAAITWRGPCPCCGALAGESHRPMADGHLCRSHLEALARLRNGEGYDLRPASTPVEPDDGVTDSPPDDFHDGDDAPEEESEDDADGTLEERLERALEKTDELAAAPRPAPTGHPPVMFPAAGLPLAVALAPAPEQPLDLLAHLDAVAERCASRHDREADGRAAELAQVRAAQGLARLVEAGLYRLQVKGPPLSPAAEWELHDEVEKLACKLARRFVDGDRDYLAGLEAAAWGPAALGAYAQGLELNRRPVAVDLIRGQAIDDAHPILRARLRSESSASPEQVALLFARDLWSRLDALVVALRSGRVAPSRVDALAKVRDATEVAITAAEQLVRARHGADAPEPKAKPAPKKKAETAEAGA